jgi:hypothetical protein
MWELNLSVTNTPGFFIEFRHFLPEVHFYSSGFAHRCQRLAAFPIDIGKISGRRRARGTNRTLYGKMG